MDLIDVHGGAVDLVVPTALHPGGVAPFVSGDVVNFAAGAGPGLTVERVGVGLHPQFPVRSFHGKFIGIIALKARNKGLPDALGDLLHGILFPIPAVEIAHHRNRGGIGSPHPEHIALLPVPFVGMGAHVCISGGGGPFMEKVITDLICLCMIHRKMPSNYPVYRKILLFNIMKLYYRPLKPSRKRGRQN